VAWTGNVFSRLYSWVNDATAGVPITASRFDADTNDIVAGFAASMQYVNITANGVIPAGIGTAFIFIGAASAIFLPVAPQGANIVRVSDASGSAGTNNITVSPSSGTIDGASTHVITSDYGSATFAFNGTNWFIVARSP